MAYNIGALRRAMRANYGAGGVDDPGATSLFAAARAIDTGRSTTKKRPSARRPRSSRPAESASAGGMTIASKGRRRSSRTRAGTRGKQHDAHIRTHIRHTAGKKAAATRKRNASKRSAAAKKAARTRASKRGGRRRASKKTRTSKRRASKTRTSRRRASRRGGKRRASRRRVSRRGLSRRSFFHGRRVRLTGREYIDKYLTRGFMPTVTRVGRLPLSRSGRPAIMTYPIPRGVGRLSRRASVRGSSRRGYAVGASYRKGKKGRHKRRMTALAANGRRRSRRGSRRSSRRRASGRRRSRRSSRRMSRNVMYATANGRRRRSRRGSRRGSRRASRRRVSRNQKYVVMNGRRRSRRASRRRGSRRASRRGFRRNSRRRMTRNMLAVSKLKYRGTGSSRVGSPKGRYYQLVEFGPKSGRKYSHAGYPVLVPPHVSQHSYVRKFRFGGAAKTAHVKAKTYGYSKRSRKMTANRKRSSRRSSMRRNQKYVVMNRRRRVRRNGLASILGGADLMRDVVTPVIGGTVGFVAARLLSNGLANVSQLRGMLDSGADAAGAANTKIAANLLGIAATLGLSTKVGIIRQNRGALVTGMGLALTDRLIQRFSAGTAVGGYLGEYVDQPMSGFGEYVGQSMSGLGTMYAAAGVGEYTNGVGEYVEGVDPANMAGVDGLMDVMEAAAGTGAMEAAAGFGDTMGSGEADASLAAMYAKRQPPFVSTEMPVGGALPITGQMPLDKEIHESLVTPEGKGYAGGVFARHLFAGML